MSFKYKYDKKELELFFYWINERHSIYLKKKNKEPWPWTKDKVLQEYKFTNPFRQLDRVTEQWTDRWMRLLSQGKNMSNGDVLFHICMFRFFNWPETYDALYFGMFKTEEKWRAATAIKILQARIDEHEKIFTGAYIITGGPKGEAKHVTVCKALQLVYEKREELVKDIMRGSKDDKSKRPTMKHATKVLQQVPTQGPFTAYEIVCDLRHTRILAHARDIKSWANAGPGAKRGIHRLLTGKFEWPRNYKWGTADQVKKEQVWPNGHLPTYNLVMRDLLKRSKVFLEAHVRDCEWPFEMREIEHSLCEYDKMRRVMLKQGKPRSRYVYKEPEEFTPEKKPRLYPNKDTQPKVAWQRKMAREEEAKRQLSLNLEQSTDEHRSESAPSTQDSGDREKTVGLKQ